MNTRPRWISLLVIYIALLIPVMIILYYINGYLNMSNGMLWMLGLLGNGLLVNLFAWKIF